MRRLLGINSPGHQRCPPGGSIDLVGVTYGVTLGGDYLFFSQKNLPGGRVLSAASCRI